MIITMTQQANRQPRGARHNLRACAAVSVGLLIAANAQAHAFLDSAAPRVGSTVQKAPKEVVLTFTQGVEPAFSKIEVTDEAGTHEETGAAHTIGSDPTKLGVAVGLLTAGPYVVSWHVTSVDTHKTQGKFKFSVSP